MKILVDTSVWSLALRRDTADKELAEKLADLISDGRVCIIGAVRQELLSGVKHKAQFDVLKSSLRAFPNLELTIEDFELAAEFFNLCRSKGVQGANTDFLICAVATNRNYEIFSTDKDFLNFAELLPIRLH